MREIASDCGRLPGDGSQPRPQALGVEGNDAGYPDPGSISKLVSFVGTLGAKPRASDSRHEARIREGTTSPVRFDHTPQVVTCEGKEYFVPVTVQCSPDAALSPTVLLDFFVHHDEFTVIRGRQLNKILGGRKVLHRELPDDNWHVMPQTRLRLIRSKDGDKSKGKSKRATRVRVEVNQESSVAFGRETSETNRYSWGEQSSGSTIAIRNCSDRTLMVVQTPTDLLTGPDSSDTSSFEVQLGEESPTSAWSNTRTMKIALPAGYELGCKIMTPGEMCEFEVAEVGETTRLLFCTLKDLPETGEVPGMCLPAEDSESATTSPSVATLSDENVDGCEVKILRVWDSMLAYGGRDIGVLPAFSTGIYLQSATVYASDGLYLAHCAIALDGNFIPATDPTATPIIRVQGLKQRKWGPLLSLIAWLHRTKMNS